MKRCSKCLAEKPETEFTIRRRSADGLEARCKTCNNAASQAQRDLLRAKVGTPEALAAWERKKASQARSAAKRRAEDPDLLRNYHWEKQGMIGMSSRRYARMLRAQGGVCAICGGGPSDNTIRLYVDHCHKTGRVRGLLCSRHNRALGLFNDDPGLLGAALAYLGREIDAV